MLTQEIVKTYQGLIDSLDYDLVEKAAEFIKGAPLTVFCGNGGSYAVATHMAGDLLINTTLSGSALALGDNLVSFSALSNDVDYASAMACELRCRLNGVKGGSPVVVLISTSGRSLNVVKAGEVAREFGCLVVSLTGSYTKALAPLSHLTIPVASLDAGLVESVHAFLGHVLVKIIGKEPPE